MVDNLIKSHWIFTRIKEHGEKPFLIFDGKSYSYAELNNEIKRISIEIHEAGIMEFTSVALISDFSFKAIACFLALFAKKCLITPLTNLSETEIERRLDDSYSDHIIRLKVGSNQLLIQENDNRKQYHELIENIFKDCHSGLILFSSGTTGNAKAMIHDLDQFLSQYEKKRSRRLTILVFLMFDHIGGLNTLFNSLSIGAKLVIPLERDAEHVANLISANEVNILPTSPTFLNLLLINNCHLNYNLSSLRIITYGTEPMPESLLYKLKSAFPKVKLLQTFGTSETGISQTVSKSSTSLLMKLDDPNIQYRIVDGELWLKSQTQIKGYLNHSMDQFTSDGWFMTGDLVEKTEDGFIKVIGRNSDIINVGGEKVFPAEIESVLMEIPNIVDCLVIGRPNAITGQAVCAQVVLQEGIDKKGIKREIRLYCRRKLSNYKVPQIVQIVEKTNVGHRFKKLRQTSKQ